MEKYWYLTTTYECPVCGKERITYRERQHTKKPADWFQRNKLVDSYDYCNDWVKSSAVPLRLNSGGAIEQRYMNKYEEQLEAQKRLDNAFKEKGDKMVDLFFSELEAEENPTLPEDDTELEGDKFPEDE